METTTISRNIHVRDNKKRKLAEDPVTATFSYDFPENVADYEALIAGNESWKPDFVVRLANQALLVLLQRQISQGLQKAVLQGTKSATLNVSEESLAEIQTKVTAFVPFQSRRAIPKRDSNRALRKDFESKGDDHSARAMFDGQLEGFRAAVERDPSKATSPALVAIYKGIDLTCEQIGLRPLSEELLEIAERVLATAEEAPAT